MQKFDERITFTCDEGGYLGASMTIAFDHQGGLDPILNRMVQFLNLLGYANIDHLSPVLFDETE
jgi:hypothetical protein